MCRAPPARPRARRARFLGARRRLAQAAAAFEGEIQLREAEEASRREEAGMYEVVPGGRVDGSEVELGRTIYFSQPNGELRRVVLLEAEYPELWEQRRRLAWLQREVARARGREPLPGE